MNRWVSTRFNLLSASVVGITAAVIMLTPRIDASLAGFALAFISTVTNDVSGFLRVKDSYLTFVLSFKLLFMVRICAT